MLSRMHPCRTPLQAEGDLLSLDQANVARYGTARFRTPFYCMSLHMEYPKLVQDNKLDGILIKHGCNTSQALQSWAEAPHYAELLRKNHSILEGNVYLPFAYTIRLCHTNRQKITTNTRPISL